MKKVVLIGLLLSVCVFVGCGGSTSSGGTTPPAATLVSIQVTPAAPSIAPSATQQFTATGTYSDGTTKNLTSTANWLSSSTSVATINTSGLATGVAPGTTTISATSGTVTGTTSLTVTNPLVSIAVTPTNASLAPNATLQYTATGTYADTTTQNITATVTWSATAGATISSTGLATAVTPGATSTIKATSGSISGSTSLIVQNPLVSIAVSPTTASIAPNATQQYTATGTYADHSTKAITSSVTWAATTGATISSSGLATGVTPNSSSTITATQGTITSNSATLSITNPLVSITVIPNPVSVSPVGPNNTQQFVATGNYADGSHQVLTTTATWTATAGATITAHGGLATAVTPNAVVTITATQSGVSGTAIMNVTNPLVSIAVTPNPVSVSPIAPNNKQQFVATGTYADNSTQIITNSVTWSASTGATITQGGLATAITPNATVTIQAAQGTIVGTAIMNVTNPLVSIAVTPPGPSIAQKTTQQFVATGTYADNSTSIITSTVTWASSNPTIAAISNLQGTQGLATAGTTAGTTLITATSGSITSPPVTLTVTSATLVSIAVTPVGQAIVYQTQQQYTAIGTFSDSTTQNITNTVTWTSSDTAHISITPTGIGGGLATGVATTTTPVTISAAQSPAAPGTTTATVIPASITSIAITPGTSGLAVGTSRQYTATATLNNGSTANYTTQVTWSSDNTAAATVGAHSGLVSGIAAGTANITATYNGVTSPALNLSVNAVNVTSITVTPISPIMPIGVTQRFSATALFSDSSTQDISFNATWTSGTTSVATINSSGFASSVGMGTTNITAAFLGVTSPPALLTVDTSTLTSIAISPSSTVLPVGKTIQFNANGKYTDGLTFSLTNLAAWSSSNPSLVSINAQTGSANTLQSGPSVNITAFYQTQTGTAKVLVTSSQLLSIAVTPAAAQVPVSVSTPFTAIGTFAGPSLQDLTSYATWATSPSSVATISNQASGPGIATGVAPGQASVTAVFAGIVNSPASTLTVTNATIMSIAVNTATNPVTAGAQVNFSALGTFSDTSVINLTSQVVWTSSDVTIATIGPNGFCNTVKPGPVTITATFNGVSGSFALTVN